MFAPPSLSRLLYNLQNSCLANAPQVAIPEAMEGCLQGQPIVVHHIQVNFCIGYHDAKEFRTAISCCQHDRSLATGALLVIVQTSRVGVALLIVQKTRAGQEHVKDPHFVVEKC